MKKSGLKKIKDKVKANLKFELKNKQKTEKENVMGEGRMLKELAAFLNTDVENVPKVLERFKREIDEMEQRLN